MAQQLYIQWLLVRRVMAGHSPLRLTAVMTLVNIGMGIFTFYYFSQLLAGAGGARAAVFQYYGGVANFMAVGVAFNALLTVGLQAVAHAISDEKQQGTFSYWVMCQPRILPLVLRASVGEFLLAAINALITFTILVLLFDVRFHPNFLSLVVVAVISIAAVSGVGLAAAGLFVGGMKGQNPIIWAWGLTTTFIAGVFAPVEVFITNPFIHTLTLIDPVTHALLAMRGAVLIDQDLWSPAMLSHVLIWGGFAVAVLPVGAWVFQRGLKSALANGKLIES